MNENSIQALADFQTTLKPYLGYFGENTWIQALVVVIASFFIAWIFNGIVINFLKKIAAKTRFDIDNQVIDLFHKPIHVSVHLLGLAVATNLMDLGESANFIIFSSLQSIAYFVWMVFLLNLTRTLLRHLASSDRYVSILHPQTLPLFLNIANITIFVIGIYVIFTAWNVDMTAWLASAGIIGIAVGFAAKDTLANLFSGVFILADAPYKIGDFVVLDTGERGEVTHIGIRSTRLLTRDDVQVTIPNSVMGNTKIINESGGPAESYRIRVTIGVAYGSDIDKVREVLMGIALADENVCEDPEPRVRMRQFGASSLDFELLCWISQPVLRGRVLDALNCQVYKRFIEEDIEIPYSKQDLYIKELPK